MTYKITKEFLKQLQEEYKYLKNFKKKELIESQVENIVQGDDRENDGYILTSELIGQNDIRLGEIRAILDDYELADEQNNSSVQIGSSFELIDLDTNRTYTYKLVEPVEVDISQNKISPESQLGSLALNKTVGQTFSLNNRKLKILKIH